ncbi:MAG: ABC transporter substrate-binding protein [Bacillota bacterium]
MIRTRRFPRLGWIALLLVAALSLAACGSKPAPATETAPKASPAPAEAAKPAPPAGPWEFTDDRGKKITLEKRPVRVVAQSNSAAALWDLGYEVVGVFGPQKRADGSNDPEIGRVDLSKVTSVGEEWGKIDLEKLAALRPDLIVTTMWAPPDLWYILPEVAPKVEAIAPIVGINIAKQPITGPIKRFGELAEALGADLNAPAVVADRKRFEQASADLKAAIVAKPGLKVLFGAGSLETFWVCLPSSYADLLYFQELGMDIVVPAGAENGFVEALSWEQAQKYPADLIVYDVRAHVTQPAELAAKIPTWNLHPAVKAGQVGRWHATASYSYKGFASILEELTATIRSAKADVVQ